MLVEDVRPEGEAEPEEESVLEVVDEVVSQRQVVERRQVPQPEVGRGQRPRSTPGRDSLVGRSSATRREPGCRNTGRAIARRRPSGSARHSGSTGDASASSGRGDDHEQQVLDHVHPEELTREHLDRALEREQDRAAGPARTPTRAPPNRCDACARPMPPTM